MCFVMMDDSDNENSDTAQSTDVVDPASSNKSALQDIDNVNTNNIKNDSNINIFLIICIVGVSLGILLEVLTVQNRYKKACNDENKPKYWVYSASSNVENENGLLKHVHLVLKRYGYEKTTNSTPWNLLWSHDYPFRVLYPNMHKLKPHQKVNKFPGTGFITNKVDLATSNSIYIPKAFKLPQSKKEFLEYASKNKNTLFLEKHNQHRGVFLKNVTEIDLLSGESFVQEYVQRPFLVDGHKFDIGVYVVLTSVDPLRVYWYKGDVLFRFCPSKYYPFDPKNLDKYVIGDDYLPPWEVPSLAHTYTALGFSVKNAFDFYARSKGHDPSQMWEDVINSISEVFVKKEKHIIEALKHYPSSDNFFEMMRFDLVLDENLKVYLLEANMSPNLSSAHYPPNQLLYEQVIYNLFSITGVGNVNRDPNDSNQSNVAAANMVSTQKNIATWADVCSDECRDKCDGHPICGLCRPCISTKLRNSLLKAHREHLHRGDFRRLYPPPTKPNIMDTESNQNISMANRLQYMWFQGKCNEDVTWCT